MLVFDIFLLSIYLQKLYILFGNTPLFVLLTFASVVARPSPGLQGGEGSLGAEGQASMDDGEVGDQDAAMMEMYARKANAAWVERRQWEAPKVFEMHTYTLSGTSPPLRYPTTRACLYCVAVQISNCFISYPVTLLDRNLLFDVP
jgi:hypothetical protein